MLNTPKTNANGLTHTQAANILRKPYHWEFIWDDEGEYWFGRIRELPGCFNNDYSIHDVFNILRETAISWLMSASHMGQPIPEPEPDSAVQSKKAKAVLP